MDIKTRISELEAQIAEAHNDIETVKQQAKKDIETKKEHVKVLKSKLRGYVNLLQAANKLEDEPN